MYNGLMLSRLRKLWKRLGPGVVTGAAGNDPSAIAVYSILGARFGLAPLWLLPYSLPLMIAIQDMSSRIGALSGCGLVGNIKRHYPAWVLLPVALIVIFVNVLNVGANIYGMAGAVNLIVPLPVWVLALGVSAGVMVMVVKLRYKNIVAIFKWFALSLFVYGITLIITRPDWFSALWHLIIPSFPGGSKFALTAFAVLGTTISPYLFFWQASEEADEIQQARPHIKVCTYRPVSKSFLKRMMIDTRIGMTMSNLVAAFIVMLAATTLFRAGMRDIETLREAASALEPLAGPAAVWLFMFGVVGSGLLAIPILAGSAAYVAAETFGWKGSLDKPFSKARKFYMVMIGAVAVSIFMPFTGISPIQALFWIAILNGLMTPPLIVLITHMANNPKIVGDNVTTRPIHIAGTAAFFVMLTGAFMVFFT